MEKGRKISSLRHIGIKKTKLVSSHKSPVETVDTENSTENSEEQSMDIERAA